MARAISSFNNPTAGVVIDNGVTDKDIYEFYLVSVAANQGISTTKRFTVLKDANEASPDQIKCLNKKAVTNLLQRVRCHKGTLLYQVHHTDAQHSLMKEVEGTINL